MNVLTQEEIRKYTKNFCLLFIFSLFFRVIVYLFKQRSEGHDLDGDGMMITDPGVVAHGGLNSNKLRSISQPGGIGKIGNTSTKTMQGGPSMDAHHMNKSPINSKRVFNHRTS